MRPYAYWSLDAFVICITNAIGAIIIVWDVYRCWEMTLFKIEVKTNDKIKARF